MAWLQGDAVLLDAAEQCCGVRWVPEDTTQGDPALWHVSYFDSDSEDLDEDEVQAETEDVRTAEECVRCVRV